MPKRKVLDSNEKKIQKYKKKIEELEATKNRKRRRIIFDTSSESEHASDVEPPRNEAEPPQIQADPRQIEEELPQIEVETPQHQANELAAPLSEQAVEDVTPVNIDAAAAGSENPVLESNSNQEVSVLPDLDPELLLALGEESGNTPQYGEKIHQSLARRWEPILKKGLPKETKEKLLKDYLVPENCTLLQAPKLNVEVAAAVSETSRQRDKRKESEQQQLGVGISAINRAMTILLTSENKIEAVKLLSDGCRILTDLHYQETQSRISVINFALAKPFLNVVQDSERDETLYGNKLPEKIKASKAIEKQGMQIKKYTKPQKTSTAVDQATTNSRSQYQGPSTFNQGNWSGPPRFQQNRGGRRGWRRTPGSQSRRPPPSTSSTSVTSQSKTRAPPRN